MNELNTQICQNFSRFNFKRVLFVVIIEIMESLVNRIPSATGIH